MFKNFIIVGLRSLWRNKAYTLINVLGLSLGLAIAIVVFLLVNEELSYDKHIPDRDEVYRVVSETRFPQKTQYSPDSPYPLAEAIRNGIPEIAATSIHYNNGGIVKRGEEKIEISSGIVFADSVMDEVFGPTWIIGNPKTSLSGPNKVVLTRSLAEEWYGTPQAAIGNTFLLDGTATLVVEGVIEDWPETSNLPVTMLVSFPTLLSFAKKLGNNLSSWSWVWSGSVWIKKDKNISDKTVSDAINQVVSVHYKKDDLNVPKYGLQPLPDIHFNTKYKDDTHGTVTSIQTLLIMGSIGFLILLIACINFINLATAQSLKRAHEVGVRKVLGSRKSHLKWQFLTETLLITLLATILALAFVEISLGKILEELDVNLTLKYDLNLLLFLAGILAFTTLAAGAYPAFVLAKFKPIKVLQGSFLKQKTGNKLSLRRSLVTFQFAISQVLIIATLICAAQLNYFENKELGFRKDQILTTSFPDTDSATVSNIRQELMLHPETSNMSFASGTPNSNSVFMLDAWDPQDAENINFQSELKIVDTAYLRLYNLEMVAGRWLDQSDFNKLNGYIVNEAFVHMIGFDSPEDALGKVVAATINKNAQQPIIGVVKNFHNKDLSESIGPCMFTHFDRYFFQLGVSVSPGSEEKAYAIVQGAWESAFPSSIFDAQYLDEQLADNYSSETAMFSLVRLFSLIALGIAIIGLYGLVAFMALQRTKEFGVRKVLGASTFSLINLLIKEFNWLILIAFVIAAPIGFWAMNEWLSTFAYRIDLNPLYFVLPLVGTALVTWLVAGWRAWWAARQNPVASLRAE
ncbi:MAG: FtsX-like permease family protein [Bacteroidia bacterium]